MKKRIKKIVMVTAALLFVCSGVSFAQDWNDRDHKSPGNAYGHYEVKKIPPSWNNKPFKPIPNYSSRYAYNRVPVHRYYTDNHWRPAPRKEVIYKAAPKDPVMVFKIILK
jgi:hypothetical protein